MSSGYPWPFLEIFKLLYYTYFCKTLILLLLVLHWWYHCLPQEMWYCCSPPLLSVLDTKCSPISNIREKIECFSLSTSRECLLSCSFLVSWLYSYSVDNWQWNSCAMCNCTVWFSNSEDNLKRASDFGKDWTLYLFLNNITCESSVAHSRWSYI